MTTSVTTARAKASITNRARRQARKSGELITVVSPVSLQFATEVKKDRLEALLREVRSCINRYIEVCWKNSEAEFNAATLNRVSGGSLSYRHKGNALKIALDTIKATKKSALALGVRPSRPHYSETAAVPLSKLVCTVEKGRSSFDYMLKVAGLVKRHPILIPVKGHVHLNDWLKKGTLLDSVVIAKDTAYLQVNVELGSFKPLDENVLGVDLGYIKLLATDDGMSSAFHGRKMKAVTDRVRRAKPGSKGRRRASRARTHYINRQVNELPWNQVSAVGIEDLTGLKQGKKPNRSKEFRKKMAPWVHRQATARIEFKAQVNRVRLVTVDPRNTSRTCPSCGKVAKENRRGEMFRCVVCNYTNDADTVGAKNILVRTRGQLEAVYGRFASSNIRG